MMYAFFRSAMLGVATLFSLAVFAHAGSLYNPSVSLSGTDADGTAFGVESVPGTAWPDHAIPRPAPGEKQWPSKT